MRVGRVGFRNRRSRANWGVSNQPFRCLKRGTAPSCRKKRFLNWRRVSIFRLKRRRRQKKRKRYCRRYLLPQLVLLRGDRRGIVRPATVCQTFRMLYAGVYISRRHRMWRRRLPVPNVVPCAGKCWKRVVQDAGRYSMPGRVVACVVCRM